MFLRHPFNHFDWIAPIYDTIIPNTNIEMLIQYGQFPVVGKVLDVGGGTGRIARELVKLQPDITLIDSSHGMLRVANHKSRVKLTQCEAERMPFSAESFERVLLVDTLHHVADASATLKECLRVLKSNGILLIQEPDIEQLGGKLIALLEKLLLMQSHLLTNATIKSTLAPFAKEISVYRGVHQFWIVCQK